MDADDTTDTQDLLSETDTNTEAPPVGFVKSKVKAVSIDWLIGVLLVLKHIAYLQSVIHK
jgi:hypothetical protein